MHLNLHGVKRWSGLGLAGFLVVELVWLVLLLCIAPAGQAWLVGMCTLHVVFLGGGVKLGWESLHSGSRRAGLHFLTVLCAASALPLGIPLAVAAWLLLQRMLAESMAGLLGWMMLALLVSLIALWVVFTIGFVAFVGAIAAKREPVGPRDPGTVAIVVLGAGLRGDAPSPLLAQRLQCAVAVAQQVRHDWVPRAGAVPLVCSGGQGPDEPCTEASAMARYVRRYARAEGLFEQGVGETRQQVFVVEEAQSTNSRENLVFSARVVEGLREAGFGTLDELIVVTSDFHAFRVKRTAARVLPGMRVTVVGSPTPASIWPASVVREYVSILLDFVRSWRSRRDSGLRE